MAAYINIIFVTIVLKAYESHRAICLVVDRKYKANKKQICKGLSKVYTSNKKMQ